MEVAGLLGMIQFSVMLGSEHLSLTTFVFYVLLAFAMISRSIARRRSEQKAYLHCLSIRKEQYVSCPLVLEISVFREPL